MYNKVINSAAKFSKEIFMMIFFSIVVGLTMAGYNFYNAPILPGEMDVNYQALISAAMISVFVIVSIFVLLPRFLIKKYEHRTGEITSVAAIAYLMLLIFA